MSNQNEFDFRSLSHGDRFWTNFERKKTGDSIQEELARSASCLLVTGFSSIQYLVDQLGASWNGIGKARIVIGSEDLGEFRERRRVERDRRFSQEIADYWTSRGISLSSAPSLLSVLELVESGHVEVRLLGRLHAKVCCFDDAVYLGSSNFSQSGMRYQYEANVRFSADEEDAQSANEIAETYWEQAEDSTRWFGELLRQLLAVVSWSDALARSISEIVHNRWMREYPLLERRVASMRLWPSQRAAIGQALYILDNCGSLLVADPTGAGKSRLGVALQILLEARIIRERGVYERPRSIVICPPVVLRNWEEEYRNLDLVSPELVSQGRLQSRVDSPRAVDVRAREALATADILFVDEAHNYLNRKSNRSRQLESAMPQQTLLFTATPINKSLSDVFRLVELLDIDSFSDRLITQIQELEKADRHGRLLTRADVAPILRRFTIRRTKDDLNRMIDDDPAAYVDDRDRPCRYPKHRARQFELGESAHDVAIATQIVELADQLRGLSRLQRVEPYQHEIAMQLSPEQIVDRRVKMAAALARYQVLARMRSSTAALIEHVVGADNAVLRYGIDSTIRGSENGNMRAGAVQLRDAMPRVDASLPAPSFLVDQNGYRSACDEEARIYGAIGDLATQFHDSREQTKAGLLGDLALKHNRVIAFDSNLITLDVIQQLIGGSVETMIVTSEVGDEEALQDAFGPFSPEKPIIGLCSDTMAEGINLQGASAVVLLSMPSVMRIAEQRIGRIDRLNSPHEEIQVYWPFDHKVFALDTDLHFYRTASDVGELLGSNIDIPPKLTERLGTEQVRRSIGVAPENLSTARAEFDAAVRDAFEPVRELYSGSCAIVDESRVELYRDVTQPVLSCVCVVRTVQPFAFYCLRGTEDRAPTWLLFDGDDSATTDLGEIADELRDRLRDAEDIDPGDETWSDAMSEAARLLEGHTLKMLPHRNRRALEVLSYCLSRHKTDDDEERRLVAELMRVAAGTAQSASHSVDLEHFSQETIRILQPPLVQMRSRNRQNRLKSINVLKAEFRKGRFGIRREQINHLISAMRPAPRLENRVVAAIIGVNT